MAKWKMFKVWMEDTNTIEKFISMITIATPPFPFCMNQYYGNPNDKNYMEFRFPEDKQGEAEKYLDEIGFFSRSLLDWNEHNGTILNYMAATKAFLDITQIVGTTRLNFLQMLDFLHSLMNQCGYTYNAEIKLYETGRDSLLNLLGWKGTWPNLRKPTS